MCNGRLTDQDRKALALRAAKPGAIGMLPGNLGSTSGIMMRLMRAISIDAGVNGWVHGIMQKRVCTPCHRRQQGHSHHQHNRAGDKPTFSEAPH